MSDIKLNLLKFAEKSRALEEGKSLVFQIEAAQRPENNPTEEERVRGNKGLITLNGALDIGNKQLEGLSTRLPPDSSPIQALILNNVRIVCEVQNNQIIYTDVLRKYNNKAISLLNEKLSESETNEALNNLIENDPEIKSYVSSVEGSPTPDPPTSKVGDSKSDPETQFIIDQSEKEKAEDAYNKLLAVKEAATQAGNSISPELEEALNEALIKKQTTASTAQASEETLRKIKPDVDIANLKTEISTKKGNLTPEDIQRIKSPARPSGASSLSDNQIDSVPVSAVNPTEVLENVVSINSVDLRLTEDVLSLTSQTQLLDEDLFDIRRNEFIMPKFYEGEGVLSYFSLQSDTEAPIYTSLSSQNIRTHSEGSPSISNPFSSGARYNQFTLKGFRETHSERFQVVETLGGQINFNFGKKPEIWSIYGTLINDRFGNWLSKSRGVWENYIRMEALISNGQYLRVVIPSSNIAFNCYPVEFTLDHSAENEVMPSFSMSMIIKDWNDISPVGFNIQGASLNLADLMRSLDENPSSTSFSPTNTSKKLNK